MNYDTVNQSPNLTGEDKKVITIESGETESSTLNCFGFGLVRLLFPANFTSCVLSCYTSDNGLTWYETYLLDDTAVIINADPSTDVFLGPTFIGAQYIKFVSSVPQTNTVQIRAQLPPVYGKI